MPLFPLQNKGIFRRRHTNEAVIDIYLELCLAINDLTLMNADLFDEHMHDIFIKFGDVCIFPHKFRKLYGVLFVLLLIVHGFFRTAYLYHSCKG